MTTEELLAHYCFNDSTVLSITHDPVQGILIVDIRLCLQAQEWYEEDSSESCLLRLTIRTEDYTVPEAVRDELPSYEILDAEETNGRLCLSLMKLGTIECSEILIRTDHIEAETISEQTPW